MPPELDTQDWSLIATALAHWAGNPNDLETPNEERAYELIEVIAADQNLSPSELVAQLE